MSESFNKSNAKIESKLNNFEKYVRRQALARFIARYELFKLQMDISGSIVECGVHEGGGLFAWAKLSANLEPIAIQRKIIGFDTFSGFPSINKKDTRGKIEKPKLMKGEFEENYNIFNELKECIKEYDNNRSRYLSKVKFNMVFCKIIMVAIDHPHHPPSKSG